MTSPTSPNSNLSSNTSLETENRSPKLSRSFSVNNRRTYFSKPPRDSVEVKDGEVKKIKDLFYGQNTFSHYQLAEKQTKPLVSSSNSLNISEYSAITSSKLEFVLKEFHFSTKPMDILLWPNVVFNFFLEQASRYCSQNPDILFSNTHKKNFDFFKKCAKELPKMLLEDFNVLSMTTTNIGLRLKEIIDACAASDQYRYLLDFKDITSCELFLKKYEMLTLMQKNYFEIVIGGNAILQHIKKNFEKSKNDNWSKMAKAAVEIALTLKKASNRKKRLDNHDLTSMPFPISTIRISEIRSPAFISLYTHYISYINEGRKIIDLTVDQMPIVWPKFISSTDIGIQTEMIAFIINILQKRMNIKTKLSSQEQAQLIIENNPNALQYLIDFAGYQQLKEISAKILVQELNKYLDSNDLYPETQIPLHKSPNSVIENCFIEWFNSHYVLFRDSWQSTKATDRAQKIVDDFIKDHFSNNISTVLDFYKEWEKNVKKVTFDSSSITTKDTIIITFYQWFEINYERIFYKIHAQDNDKQIMEKVVEEYLKYLSVKVILENIPTLFCLQSLTMNAYATPDSILKTEFCGGLTIKSEKSDFTYDISFNDQNKQVIITQSKSHAVKNSEDANVIVFKSKWAMVWQWDGKEVEALLTTHQYEFGDNLKSYPQYNNLPNFLNTDIKLQLAKKLIENTNKKSLKSRSNHN